MMVRRAVRAMLAAGVVAVALTAAPIAVSAATLPMPFSASVSRCAIGGFGPGPDRIVHRSATGATKAVHTPKVTGGFPGSWSVTCTKPVLVPGDTLTFQDLTDPQNPAIIQKVTIPLFTAVTDRVLDRVTGTAKGVAALDVGLVECLMSVSCETRDNGTISTGSGGSYTYAPAKAITGIWSSFLTRRKNGLDLYLEAQFPQLVVTHGSATVTGAGSPGQKVKIQVDRAGKAATATRTITAARAFKGTVKRNGVPRMLKSGDRVRWWLEGRLLGDFIVPAKDVSVGPTHTFGRCFPNATVAVTTWDATKTSGYSAHGTTDADGSFDVTITAVSGGTAVVSCRTKAGDVVTVTAAAGG